MAVFTPDSVGNINGLTDLKKVQEYLYRLNEQLQYVLRNLTPEDNNASGTPSLSYATGQTVKIIIDGKEMDVVLANEVIHAINESLETEKIGAGRISINGIASAGNNFTISGQGVAALTNPYISGGTVNNAAVTGGTIAGADVSNGTMSGTAISNATETNTALQTGSVGPFDVDANGISNSDMSIADDGTAELAELTLADSFWNNQTVTQVVKTIWDAVFPTTP